MKNIFRSLFLSSVGIASIGWISFIFIGMCLSEPPLGLVEYFANNIIHAEQFEESGQSFTELSEDLFLLIGHMNLFLLSFTILMTLSWATGSHYLNIDAPGKAKIYSIHWLIFTGIYVAVAVGAILWFTKSATYFASDYIGGGGETLLFFSHTIYYFLIYYVGVVLGTARFARSSVLFANKLPGNL
jgi:hypothetical protein